MENKADGAASFMVGTTEYAVPLGNMIDVEAEIARMEAELKHKTGRRPAGSGKNPENPVQ